MDKIKKIFLVGIPMSICNFRCSYCYLAQRDEHYQGIQPIMKYTPEEVGRAMTKERIGGPAYFNFCADGETLLTKDIDKYVKVILENGHYVELVTNLTVTPVLEKILAFDKEILKHLEFKCSFHYLELKKKGLLERFAKNVHRIWSTGASANIEITPSDELIPFLEEVKQFSMDQFGALPHLSIARRDDTKKIDYLTELSMDEYDKIWGAFDSDFWKFKKTIFGQKRNEFCYAGKWSLQVNLATGMARQCYIGESLGDIFANPNEPLPERAIGYCSFPHCYNGHMLLTLGCIPRFTDVCYGNIRDRESINGYHWIKPEMKQFLNTKLEQSNDELAVGSKIAAYVNTGIYNASILVSKIKDKAKKTK